MKPLHYRLFAITSPIKQVLLTAPLLITGAVALAASNTETTHADPTPVLALYQTVDNNTEPACAFDLPALGSGTTAKFFPKKTCPEVEDDPIEPHAIRIRNMPIASKFLLTDNERCEKTDSAWVELETTRANASLEKLGIDKIWTYSGYLTNAGLDSNAPSRGFKVIARGNPIKQGELTCVTVSTSVGSK
ncbi:hypothetical protein ACIPZG_23775 [Pseudomonas sp. NPDC089395]|uniref:hypothetical protein n=1 Tax=Pseudomonas sp. NPDC089395 TaxID=3364460 RepID=UPI0038082254